MNIVVVESPAKASTIGSYLGGDYRVLATYGHVRDLVEKDGAVVPEERFRMRWRVDPQSAKRIREVADALKGGDRLLLATDPDREGEAISWHLVEALKEGRKIGPEIKVERISFNAITRAAVAEALERPREIDRELVDAYLARRALDHLVGFRLSPVLWRALPGARSAGRVQSVAVRLLHERELEIEAFEPREHWSAIAKLRTERGDGFEARLVALDGEAVGRFDLPDEASAGRARAVLLGCNAFRILSVEAKSMRQKPPPPFITSTLQQDANRKLGFSASRTMSVAQRLYESAWITYMRTDGVDMAPEAVKDARRLIAERWGADHLPGRARVYKSKVKNAQEAHECVRPTDLFRPPEAARGLPGESLQLYRLIWERTVASQMSDALLERTTASIAAEDGEGVRAELRATGQVVRFEGYRRAYREGRGAPEGREVGEADANSKKPAARESGVANGESDSATADSSRELPPLSAEDRLILEGVGIAQHFTKPPPRYSEASLVQKLEQLGIGRPSTYASILSTIQNRGYAEKSGRQLTPTFLGRMTAAFLTRNFERYVADDFTAGLEERLDDISGGRATSETVLQEFWTGFAEALQSVDSLTRTEAVAAVEEVLDSLLYPPRSDGIDPHLCPACKEGRLSLRWSRTGGMFLGCGRFPDCDFRRSLDRDDHPDWLGDRPLGADGDGSAVSVRRGPYGFYLQLDSTDEGEASGKPRRVGLPEKEDPTQVDLELALRYLALPREIGPHPESGKPVRAGIGRYGPYVLHDRLYASIPKEESVFEVGINRAVDLLASKASRRPSAKVLKELGEHPDGGPVQVLDGSYGPYVKWSKINANVPAGIDPSEVTMESALTLIDQRAKRKPKTAARRSIAAKRKPKTAKRKPKTRSERAMAEVHAGELMIDERDERKPKTAARRSIAAKRKPKTRSERAMAETHAGELMIDERDKREPKAATRKSAGEGASTGAGTSKSTVEATGGGSGPSPTGKKRKAKPAAVSAKSAKG